MKKLLDYIRYSSIVLMIQFNPIAWWKVEMWWDGPDDMAPGKILEFHFRVLMFRFNVMLDDGSW